MLPDVRQAIGRRVIVSGTLSYAEHGRLLAVASIDSLTPVDDRAKTTLNEILGIAPDFTDGLAVDQFIEWIHNDPEP